MSETRKLATILVADGVGYRRLASANEDRTLAGLRGLRSDLIDPAIAAHHGRIVRCTGDGLIVAHGRRRAREAVRTRARTFTRDCVGRALRIMFRSTRYKSSNQIRIGRPHA